MFGVFGFVNLGRFAQDAVDFLADRRIAAHRLL